MSTTRNTRSPERLAKIDEYDREFTGSPAVARVEMFRMDGNLYDTFEKALSAREDSVEKFLRPMFSHTTSLHKRDEISIIEWIITNRAQLLKLLDY